MRVVLDTNIIISSLVFPAGQLGWLKEAWKTRQITLLINKFCAEELLRALAYPKFRLSAEEIQMLLGDYLPHAITIDSAAHPGKMVPRRKDPHDQKFLDLAWAGDAQALITGDKALLELRGKTPIAIMTIADFRKQFESRS